MKQNTFTKLMSRVVKTILFCAVASFPAFLVGKEYASIVAGIVLLIGITGFGSIWFAYIEFLEENKTMRGNGK